MALAFMDGWLRKNPDGRSLVRVVVCAISTRLVLWLVGDFAVRLQDAPLHFRARQALGESPGIAAWLRWDVWWYVSIIDRGYRFAPDRASNAAFLPGYPALSAAVATLVGNGVVAGLLVANVSFFAALLVFWNWIRERAGSKAAERATLCLLFFPTSFFFNTLYAEALFFLCCTLSLRQADRGRWALSGIYGCLAALTRPVGIFLVPACGWALVREQRAARFPRHGWLAVVLPAAGVAAHAAYLGATVGTPFAVFAAHRAGWGVGRHLNLLFFERRSEWFMALFSGFQVVLPFVLAALVVVAWRKLGSISGIYAVLAAALGIVFASDSVGREALDVVPAFGAVGLLRWRAPSIATLYVAECALLVSFSYAFVTGFFVG